MFRYNARRCQLTMAAATRREFNMIRHVAPILPSISIGPRVRKSPFYDATRRWGCNAYSVYNHMYMPLFYTDPTTDFWNLVRHVTLWDVACERQVEITGPDAARFTQYLTPRNLSQCAVGQAKYVFICNDQGNVINDPILFKLAEDRFWLSLADNDILLWARGIAQCAGLDVAVSEPDVSPLQVQGPKSTALMVELFGNWIEQLKYYWFQETELDGIPLLVSRTGWSSERGYEIFLRDGRYGDRLWELIMDRGKPFQIAPGAPSTIRRIEGGMLSYGGDMNGGDNPFELGFERLVDLDQSADFVGRRALQEARAAGLARRLCGIEIHGQPVPGNEDWWPVSCNDSPAGTVRSAAYSPRLDKNIALAMVDIEHCAPGTAVKVAMPDGPRSGTVTSLPFYDPRKSLATGHK